MTQSHVDIYSPHTAPELPISLRELPHLVTNITVDAPTPSTKNLAESVQGWNLPSFRNSTYHLDYHPLFEIDGFINELAALYPNVTHVYKLGHSALGREMVSMTISTGAEVAQDRKGQLVTRAKPAFVIVGAQHAREVRLKAYSCAHPCSVLFDSGWLLLHQCTWPMHSQHTRVNRTLFHIFWTSSFVSLSLDSTPFLTC
jgi:hypothetical protein